MTLTVLRVNRRPILYRLGGVRLWMDVAQITESLKQGPARWRVGSGVAGEIPDNIYRYVLATSFWHQLPLVVLTVAVFLLEIAPLELQRRIVNDLVKHRDFSFIVVLCAVYAGTVLVQGGTKLVLNVYRSWVGERATRDLRRRVHACPGRLDLRRLVDAGGRRGAGLDDRRRGRIDRRVRRRGRFRAPAAGRHPGFGAGLHDPRRFLDGGDGVPSLRPAAGLRAADAGRDEPAHPTAGSDHPAAQHQRRRGDSGSRGARSRRRGTHPARLRTQHGDLQVQVLDELPDEPQHAAAD